MRVTQRTDFPSSEKTRLIFSCARPSTASVKIRHPFWAGPVRIELNGETVLTDSAAPGYAVIRREWKTGDTLDVTLPMSIRLEPVPDMITRAAVMYGPILLAGDLGPVAGTRAVPLLVTNGRSVGLWTKQVPGRPLTFETRGVGRPEDVTLTPFFMMHDRRYAVYWDCVTDRKYQEHESEAKSELSRERSLQSRTVDSLLIGDAASERAHRFEGEMTTIGHYRGRTWRQATGTGWFSYEMSSRPGARLQLVVTYWGSESEKREFDIIVDGLTVATQSLSRNSPGEFFDATYLLSPDLTKGKGTLSVRFSPHRGAIAGRVFGSRLVTR